MSSLTKNWYFLATASLLLFPAATFGSATYSVEINSVCIQGTCPPPAGAAGAVLYGDSTSGSGSHTEVVNGDTYDVSWTYSASFGADGTEFIVDPTVTYEGASPTAQSDTITFDLFQSFYDDTPGTWDGSYTETVPLDISGGAGTGSSASAQVCYYSSQRACLPLVGPFTGPGYELVQNTGNITPGSNDTLTGDYQFTFVFGAGTTNGASESSTPEPSDVVTLGLAMLGMVAFGLRRRAKLT